MRKDSEWGVIDGEPCRVTNFTPLAGMVRDGKVIATDKTTPYASIAFECKKIPNTIRGFITHKMDFANLWSVFKERGVKQDEEVIIFWSKKNYKVKILNLLPVFWPKLHIILCPKGAWEATDSSWNLELNKFRWDEIKIAEWKPEMMK